VGVSASQNFFSICAKYASASRAKRFSSSLMSSPTS
jgi:hypothetical protein